MAFRERLLAEGAGKSFIAASYFCDGSNITFQTKIFDAC
jgi:hypothetical protein